MQTKVKANASDGLHEPVLLNDVLKYLDPRTGEAYLDLTAGYGGHAAAILERTKYSKAVLVDRDEMAISELQKRFVGETGIKIIKSDFYTASQMLVATNEKFDVILADLGVSSPHLDIASRGFSFSQEGPLDMRMDQSQSISAETIVNSYSEAELKEILTKYGEEPKAGKIAHIIMNNRPIRTTTQLALLVAKAYPGHSKSHPATRTFQAIRIAVNDELRLVERSLPLWCDLLNPGGRLGVISFHSLEDRIVKQFFADRAGDRYDAELRLLTKRPIVAEQNELVLNPRSRSAKLRVAAK